MWHEVTPVAEHAAVDRATFAGEIWPAGAPVVLRGQVAAWPIAALADAPDRDFCAWLANRANAAPAQLWVGAAGGAYGFAADARTENFARKLAPVAEICALLLRATAEAGAPAIFAGAVNLAAHLPALLPEVLMPLLAPERERLTSLWIGTPSRTALHWDLPDNLSCVVRGTRHYLLFPPGEVGNLYMGPLDRTLAGQATSLIDCAAPDLARFPRYAEALRQAQRATLAPGDVLFIPSLWFHHVVSPAAIGAQINFWWRANNAETLSPLSTVTHALLTLRDLPAPERAAWRAFFDHYIFAGPEAATAHLPPGAEGMLGPMTRARELQLSERLVNELAGWHNARLKRP